VLYIPSSSSIEEIYRDIALIAEVLGVKERGDEMIRSMKEDIAKTAARGAAIKNRRNVYFEISPPPGMVSFGGGTYLHEMIEIIGAKNIFDDVKDWFSPSAEAIINRNPDVILTPAYSSENPIPEIKSRPGFETITAVKENRVYAIDADPVSRPSQNIILALRQIAHAVYPEVYENN
jgi:iron complex transport system substrate-binding protein